VGPDDVPSRPASEIAETAWERYRRLDERVITTLRRISLPLLRLSLGIVFVWFGALKVAGVTPVDDLVASVVYWVDPSWFVPVLGVFEVAVGAGLIIGRAMRLVLLLFAAQMVGTFLVFLVLPDVAFQGGNPLLLTVEGEFVVKNLVLLSAGLVVGSQVPRPRAW
jgi:putative oxidoreductase